MSGSELPRQVFDVTAKSDGDALQNHNRRVPAPPLDPAQIGLMHLGAMGELFLREPKLPPAGLQVAADSHTNVHGAMARSSLMFGP